MIDATNQRWVVSDIWQGGFILWASMDINQYSLIWLSIGILLLASEIFTGTFYLLLIGVSAILVAILNYFIGLSWPLQIIILGILSAISIFSLRGKLMHSKSEKLKTIDKSNTVIVLNAILPHAEGLVQYQGVPWAAINQSDYTLNAQQVAIVVETQGNKLMIKPKTKH